MTQTGARQGVYSFGPPLDATGNFGSAGTPYDFINVNIAGLKNPSLIPLSILEPQVPQPGTTLPGLSFICAHPLPPSQCTQTNACGCTPADFAPIVAEDEAAKVANESTPPSTIDQNRYVSTNQNLLLQGPQQQGAAPVKNTYSVTDANMTGNSTALASGYAVAFSRNWTIPADLTLGISTSNSFSFTRTLSSGTTSGTAHTATVTLGTSKVGCSEYANVYEDAVYHTFAFSLAQAAPPVCQ